MMNISKAIIIAGALMLSPHASASPIGNYDVEGRNPGSASKYDGSVTVRRTGDTYSVRWRVGRTNYIGTGLGASLKNGKFFIGPASADDTMIAVGYASGRSFGMAFFIKRKNDQWQGIWTYGGSRKIGRESWFPR